MLPRCGDGVGGDCLAPTKHAVIVGFWGESHGGRHVDDGGLGRVIKAWLG